MADPKVVETCVQTALALRAAWGRAGVDFFKYLAEWEADETRWKGDPGARTGYDTFSALLHSANIVEYQRFLKFKKIVARFGLKQVYTVGLDAAEELNKIPENAPSRREPEVPAATAAMRAAQTSTESHTTPSRRWARTIVRQHYEPPPKEKEDAPKYDDRVKQLEHEVAVRDRTIAALTKANAKLKKALAAAEATLTKAPSGKVRKAA